MRGTLTTTQGRENRRALRFRARIHENHIKAIKHVSWQAWSRVAPCPGSANPDVSVGALEIDPGGWFCRDDGKVSGIGADLSEQALKCGRHRGVYHAGQVHAVPERMSRPRSVSYEPVGRRVIA